MGRKKNHNGNSRRLCGRNLQSTAQQQANTNGSDSSDDFVIDEFHCGDVQLNAIRYENNPLLIRKDVFKQLRHSQMQEVALDERIAEFEKIARAEIQELNCKFNQQLRRGNYN